MTILALLRMFGALAIVLGLLAGALWAVRRFDIRLPGRLGTGGTPEKRLEVVERLTVDQKRSLLLVRRDNVEHLVLMAPEGNVVLHEARTDAPALRLIETPAPKPAPAFAALVEPEPVAMFDAARDGGDAAGSTAFLSNLERVHNFAHARIARHA
ncbi:FliO/MopB family protein [Sphingomonas sp.]|jgi:flagellar protein FliO/FliZ|uniref:FliO/MopB family protein n=1 Tax=Sphingomonas sp. TaxID=28214 RepID=UPI003BAA903F